MNTKNRHLAAALTAAAIASLVLSMGMACTTSSPTTAGQPGTTTTSGPSGIGAGDQPASVPTPSEPTDTSGTDPNAIAPPPKP